MTMPAARAPAGEPLVDERPHRVNVAEDDPVHAVVHIMSSRSSPASEAIFRHAQAEA